MAIDPNDAVPARASDDPEVQACWYYGVDSMFSHYRRVMIAACEESLRASIAASGKKVTDGRVKSMAHLHPAYLKYLGDHLHGRTLWMQTFLKDGGIGR